MAKILNLDKLLPEDRFFILNGVRYCVPGNLSVKTVLELSKTGSEVQNDPSKITDALALVWRAISPKNPDKEEIAFMDSIAISLLPELLGFIFNNQGGEDEVSELADNSKNVSGQVVQ